MSFETVTKKCVIQVGHWTHIFNQTILCTASRVFSMGLMNEFRNKDWPEGANNEVDLLY
jgi:hypothetical protein